MSHGYRDLRVWNKAMELAQLSYEISEGFPADERFGLTSQLRRAVVSVPSNIAEGQGRATRGEFQQFLANARGSLYEAQTQVQLARRLQYLDDASSERFDNQSREVANLLNALIRSIREVKPTRNTKHETRNS